jgi:hypothetical protein
MAEISLNGQQGEEAKHGHPTVQGFGVAMEAVTR